MDGCRIRPSPPDRGRLWRRRLYDGSRSPAHDHPKSSEAVPGVRRERPSPRTACRLGLTGTTHVSIPAAGWRFPAARSLSVAAQSSVGLGSQVRSWSGSSAVIWRPWLALLRTFDRAPRASTRSSETDEARTVRWISSADAVVANRQQQRCRCAVASADARSVTPAHAWLRWPRPPTRRSSAATSIGSGRDAPSVRESSSTGMVERRARLAGLRPRPPSERIEGWIPREISCKSSDQHRPGPSR